MKKEFSDSGFTKCLSFPFEFEDQLSLRLDVPHEGTTIDSGWRLSPLYEPMVCSQLPNYIADLVALSLTMDLVLPSMY